MAKNRPYRARCEKCLRQILWLETSPGKRWPVDPKPIRFVIGGRGDQRFMKETKEGYELMPWGQKANELEEDHDVLMGWPLHFDTCPMEEKKKRRF